MADEGISKRLLGMKVHSIRIAFHGQSGVGNQLRVTRNGVKIPAIKGELVC